MKKGSYILYTILLLAFGGVLSLNPAHNWDMVGYIGCVISLDEDDPKEIHRKTYKIIKEEVSEEKYKELTEEYSYRAAMAKNYKAFYENLPYYKVRILYIVLIKGIAALGVPLTVATMFPSVLSILCMSLLIFYVFNRLTNNTPISTLIALFFLTCLYMVQLGRFRTPDALSSLMLLLLLVMYMFQYRKIYLYIVMICLPFIRTDTIIFLILFLVFDGLRTHKRLFKQWGYYIGFVLGLISIVLLIHHFANNYGWWVAYYHGVIKRTIFPLLEVPSFSFDIYIKPFMDMKRMRHIIPYCFLAMLYVYVQFRKPFVSWFPITRSQHLILTSICTFFGKFLIFPLLLSRLNFILILICILALCIENKHLFIQYKQH